MRPHRDFADPHVGQLPELPERGCDDRANGTAAHAGLVALSASQLGVSSPLLQRGVMKPAGRCSLVT